jgi:hypothetical protein
MVTFIVIRVLAGIHRAGADSRRAMDRGRSPYHYLQKRRPGSPAATEADPGKE